MVYFASYAPLCIYIMTFAFQHPAKVWVPVEIVLTLNVMEETNEKLLKFTLRFKDDLAVLQASESNELHCENFEVNLK